jgi:predicted kinase
MKFIMLNGPSCAGKSTIVSRIMAEKERYYKLSYDAQKWLFSKYDRNIHFEDVRTVQRGLAETVCGLSYNIICDSALYKENREKLLSIPKKYGYEVIEINLEADYETLAVRFDERVKDALAKNSKTISSTSKERFKELYDIYQSEKNSSAVVLRTDLHNQEEIFKSILELI